MIRLSCSLLVLLSLTTHAETVAVGKGNFKIVYGSAGWNKDSTQVDNAFLFMRDKQSKKLVKIRLEETEPDSSLFSGNFVVNWGGAATVDPEVYIPPKGLRDNPESVAKFTQTLASGTVKGKPLIIKTESSGARIIDVYDTPEQAKRAQSAYQAEVQAQKEEASSKLLKPAVKPQDGEAASKMAQQQMLDKLSLEAAKREAERIRLEQIERQKTEERERQARALSDADRLARISQAAALADQANAHYQNAEFPLAEDKYRQSVDLDPSNKSYYFKYGVSLYRNEKFNEALIVLKLAPADTEHELERRYYLGLIHLRLKELDAALIHMQAVAQTKSVLAPSASFYEGIIWFSKEDYDKARAPFERVIDTSTDPRLDEQAEEYLDRLTAMAQQKKLMSRRWFLGGMVGTMYDSNVLFAPDTETAQGSAAQEGDIRLQASAEAEYRPLYTPTHEWGAKALGYYLYSLKDEVSRADPFLLNLSSPYTYKGLAFGKGYKMALRPAFEIVYMDANEDSDRELILQSLVLGFDNTFVMEKSWFATYGLEVRQDDSQTQDSTGDNDADALKATLKTSQLFLLDKSQREALTVNAAYVMNNAKGNEKLFNRIDFGVMYSRPIENKMLWNAGLSFYLLRFDKAEEKREDKNITFSTGVTKPVQEWWSWNVSGSYTNNGSTDSDNQYSRYTISASAIFNLAL